MPRTPKRPQPNSRLPPQSALKVTGIFKSKSDYKKTPPPTNNLYVKIKPSSCKNELFVTYEDFKQNFPEQLLEYYQNKVNLSSKVILKTCSSQTLQRTTRNFGNIINNNESQKSNSLKSQKDITECLQQYEKNELKGLTGESRLYKQSSNQQWRLILDYDRILQNREVNRLTSFHCSFPTTRKSRNPYIKQLRQGEEEQEGSAERIIYEKIFTTQRQTFQKGWNDKR